MSNVYSLDTLRSDLDKQFAPLQLTLGDETYTLRSLMRIKDSDRNAALKSLAALDNKSEDEADSPESIGKLTNAIYDVIRAVTKDGKGQKIVDYIDEDLSLAMKIIELWTEATQPGEAQNSPA